MSDLISGENGEKEDLEGETDEPVSPGGRANRGSSRRRLAAVCIAFVGLLAILTLLHFSGATSSYIKSQFAAKMDRMGMTFSAERFDVSLLPIRVAIRNARFSDETNGERLIDVERADLALTVRDIWAMRLRREISIDTAEVTGAKIFISFDENGKSNFANLKMVEEDDAIKVTFRASSLSVKDSQVVFGDRARKIDAETKNLFIELKPRDFSVPDDEKSYDLVLGSKDAFLSFGQKKLEGIDIDAKATLRPDGIDVESTSLNTPAGQVSVNGRINGWDVFEYDLNLESNLNVTTMSEVFPLGVPLTGEGTFSGRIYGKGEEYRVVGTVTSTSLTASNVALKGLDLSAALESRDGAYEANGKAVADVLTFEEFKIDLIQMSGLIRGSGTDFKWIGELQAAAAKTGSGTIGGLFISDAVAEYGEKKGYASDFGTVRAKSYALDDLLITDIQVGDLVISSADGTTGISTTGAKAGSLKTDSVRLGPIQSGPITIRDRGPVTDIKTDRLASTFARVGDFEFRDLTSSNVGVVARGGITDIRADELTAQSVVSEGVDIGRMSATGLDIRDNADGFVAVSKGLSVAKIDVGSAVIGSINVGGARLSILRGVVEFTSDDFDAGEITLPGDSVFADGGKLKSVKVSKPIYVLERSGRYRASADMSLGGGVIGSIELGSAKASVTVTDEGVTVQELSASVMDGSVSGTAAVSFDSSKRSNVSLRFTDLDVSKTLAIQGGRLLPVDGHANGTFELEFDGTDWKTASGRLEADIDGETGHGTPGSVPVAGRIAATGTAGLFQIESANLKTASSVFDAKGSIDLSGNAGKLKLDVASEDAGEIERIIRAFDLSDELRKSIDEYRVELAGSLRFDGEILGNISKPVIDAFAKVSSFSIRGRQLGALEAQIVDSSEAFELRKATLSEADGGTLVFDLFVPSVGVDNTSVSARLRDINIGNILSALPFELPRALRELKADTSGIVDLRGLPDAMEGDASLTAANASIGSESFDRLEARARFAGTRIAVDSIKAFFGKGSAEASGSYETDTTRFDFNVNGAGVPLSRLRALASDPSDIPQLEGTLELQGRALGLTSDSSTYDFRFNGTAKNVVVKSARVGNVEFRGVTENKILTMSARMGEAPGAQTLDGTIDFNDPRMRFDMKSVLSGTALDPYITLARDSDDVPITGRATGTIELRGNLLSPNAEGALAFGIADLGGRANFSQFEVQIDQTPLVAVEPVVITLSDDELVFEKAAFSGGGSNLRVSGVKALSGKSDNTLAVVGRVNLAILNAFLDDTFFAGFGDLNIRLNGPNETARLNGRADLVSASISTFVSSERVSLDRLKGTVIFTSNQAQFQNATGVIGGGNVTVSGGALLNEDLELDSFKLDLRGDNVSVPLPKNFLTTGDAVISVSGRRAGTDFNSFISGRINARRSVFTTNIDLADVIGQRRDSPLAQSRTTTGYGNIGLDVIIEGRDALVVRNNLADLTASLSLRVTGNVDTPQVAGRITANSGTLFFRYERYEVQRGELLFPPNTAIEPLINLQAEAEIQGYQVLVNLNGSLSDMDTLNATVRSNPALPQADVISLITTGSLTNTQAGIPTTTQSGISAAADILTDEIISKPISKATDKLFGLNRFELDPIISGQRLNPTARLTVGRQINRNLLITYSTNLAQDQNQVLAFEYRLSNRLSFVAQYEQRSIANVTQKSDGFSFEVRLRKRF